MDSPASATIRVGAISIDFLVDADDSGGSVTVFECAVPADAKVPIAHSHDAFDETIYGLEGVCTWTIDGQARELGPGDSVCIRRGQVHSFKNRGSVDVKFLAIATPGVFGPSYFRDVAQVLAAAAGGPPDLAAMGEVMRRHGLTPAQPVATWQPNNLDRGPRVSLPHGSERPRVNYGCSARRIGALALVVASLGVVSAFGTSGAAASPSAAAGAASGPLPARTEAKVRRIVRRFRDVNRTPGVLVGIWSPRGKFVSAKGVANLATGRRLNTRMQFKIGSQTKAFIAVLVLQLVGEKKVSLDDHISKWVAGVPNGDQVTIRQLLNHTSGLGNPFPTEQVLGRVTCTPADLLALGASAPPVAPPGTKWAYSNYAYNLLGRVVELASGQDVSTAIRERIARPLGLRRTLLATSGNGLSKPFAHGYGLGEVGPTQAPKVSDDATALNASCLWAAGGMVSTLSDLRVWSRALATGALLKPAVWREAKKDAIPFVFEGRYNGPGRWRYGLGFSESGGFIGKEGSLPGYESTAMYSPARKTAIVVVSTKQANAITPPPTLQALAMAVFGPHIGFGLTPAEALKPNYFEPETGPE